MLPVRKILSTTDFSEPSLKGVAVANELAGFFGAELILVTVVTPMHPEVLPKIPKSSELHKEMVQYNVEKLQQVVAEKISAGVRTRQIVASGNAADEIVAIADLENVDLLVIATHGWTGWRRFMFGSVTEKVIRSVTCPVLTVSGPFDQ
jgi:nucleotide-binding universal stress UspA family protein